MVAMVLPGQNQEPGATSVDSKNRQPQELGLSSAAFPSILTLNLVRTRLIWDADHARQLHLIRCNMSPKFPSLHNIHKLFTLICNYVVEAYLLFKILFNYLDKNKSWKSHSWSTFTAEIWICFWEHQPLKYKFPAFTFLSSGNKNHKHPVTY